MRKIWVVMKESCFIMTMATVLMIVALVGFGDKQIVYADEDTEKAAEALDICAEKEIFNATEGATATYKTTENILVIRVKVEKGICARVSMNISGITDKYEGRITEYSKNGEFKGASSIPKTGTGGRLFGGTEEYEGYLCISKPEAEENNGVEINVELSSTIVEITTETREVKPEEEVFGVQTVKELYWPIKIEKTGRLTFDEGGVAALCDSNKYELISHPDGIIIEKGDYFLLTKNTSEDGQACYFDFSYNVSPIGIDADKNTSLKKAKDIKVSKKTQGLFVNVPESDASYYKLTISKSGKLQIAFTQEKAGVIYSVDILDSEGESVASTMTLHAKNVLGKKKKGKLSIGRYTWENDELVEDVSNKLALEKGTYYIKVSAGYQGKYSLTVKSK